VNLTGWSTNSSREDGNAQRSAAGWVTARDRLHGRVVDRRWVVEMAPPYILDSVVNGRATDPDPRRQRACSRSARAPLPIKPLRRVTRLGRGRADARPSWALARLTAGKV